MLTRIHGHGPANHLVFSIIGPDFPLLIRKEHGVLADGDNVPVFELAGDDELFVHKGPVPALTVSQEKTVPLRRYLGMLAGHNWIFNGNVVIVQPADGEYLCLFKVILLNGFVSESKC